MENGQHVSLDFYVFFFPIKAWNWMAVSENGEKNNPPDMLIHREMLIIQPVDGLGFTGFPHLVFGQTQDGSDWLTGFPFGGPYRNPTPATHLNGAREFLPSSQEIFDTKPLRMIKFGIKRWDQTFRMWSTVFTHFRSMIMASSSFISHFFFAKFSQAKSQGAGPFGFGPPAPHFIWDAQWPGPRETGKRKESWVGLKMFTARF